MADMMDQENNVKPSMNGVAERQNQTLKDMVRSIVSHSSLQEPL